MTELTPAADWTTDPETGRSNYSARFRALATEVEGILRRSGGLSLSPQWAASTARLILAQLAHQHGLQISGSGPAPSPDAEPAPLNLPAYAWGESVTWNQGRILVPLNRDNQTVADLVLDEDAAGTLAAMLDDAAGHKPPDCPRCFDRGYVPAWSRGLSAEHGEPGKKPCPDCAPPVQGHLELEPMPCHQPQRTWASNHGCDPCATCGRCRICDAVARETAERTPPDESIEP